MTAFHSYSKAPRCGWCIAGDHAGCVVAVEMGVDRNKKVPAERYAKRYFWVCPCPWPGHPATRCQDCQRPNVDIDHEYRCINRQECEAFTRLVSTEPEEDENDESAA